MRLDLRLPWLLGLAALPACSDDGLASQSAGQAATSTTAADGSDGNGSLPATTGVDEGTTATPGDSTSGGESPTDTDTTTTGHSSSTTTTTTTTDDSEGTTESAPNQACTDGCAVEFMCGTDWASEDDCVAWCEANLMKAGEFSPFCRAAWENVSACLATLTCEEFEQWQNPEVFPYPCSDADVVLAVECEGQ